MKKLTLVILLTFVFSKFCFAQFGGNNGVGAVWHFPGQMGIEGGLGLTGVGYDYHAAFAQYIKNNVYYKLNLSYQSGSFSGVDIHSYNAGAFYYYSPYSFRESLFLNLGIGGLINFDKAIGFWTIPKNKLNPGIAFSVEIESSLSEYFMFTCSGTQDYLIGNSFGGNRYVVQVGLKYLIN